METVKVTLKDIACTDFEKIPQYLENEKLSIVMRYTTFPEVLKRKRLPTDKSIMILYVKSRSGKELHELVTVAVSNINAYFNEEFAFVDSKMEEMKIEYHMD